MNTIELGNAIANALGGQLDDRIAGTPHEPTFRINRERNAVWVRISLQAFEDLARGDDLTPVFDTLIERDLVAAAARGGKFVLTHARLIREEGD